MSFNATNYAETFRRDGYYICENVLSPGEVDELRQAIADLPAGDEVRRKQSVYGVRNLLQMCPAVRELAGQPHIRQFVVPLLGESTFAVRAIFFDKGAGANWSLSWHQDKVIAVAQRASCPATSAGRTKPASGKCSRQPTCLRTWSPCAFISMTVGPRMVRCE